MAEAGNSGINLLDMQSQDGGFTTDMAGMTPELGSELANMNGMM